MKWKVTVFPTVRQYEVEAEDGGEAKREALDLYREDDDLVETLAMEVEELP